jgi:hypothetical protein
MFFKVDELSNTHTKIILLMCELVYVFVCKNLPPVLVGVFYDLKKRLALKRLTSHLLTFRNPASYIKDGHTATFNTPHFLYFFNKYTY